MCLDFVYGQMNRQMSTFRMSLINLRGSTNIEQAVGYT